MPLPNKGDNDRDYPCGATTIPWFTQQRKHAIKFLFSFNILHAKPETHPCYIYTRALENINASTYLKYNTDTVHIHSLFKDCTTSKGHASPHNLLHKSQVPTTWNFKRSFYVFIGHFVKIWYTYIFYIFFFIYLHSIKF
jgi:hypothetical protein